MSILPSIEKHPDRKQAVEGHYTHLRVAKELKQADLTRSQLPVFPGNSVGQPYTKPPTKGSRGIDPFRGKQVPPNNVKAAIIGDMTKGPMAYRYGSRSTRYKGTVNDAKIMHSHRGHDEPVQI